LRTVGALKSRQVLTAKPPKGRRSVFLLDGSGLYLQASIGRKGTIRRSWSFRYQLAGKRHEMGLGSLPALPFERMPEFMAALRGVDSLTARALELLILTASRTRELRLATWSEIDWGEKKWNRPGSHMKGGEDHTAALCDRAIEALRVIGPGAPDALILPTGYHLINRLVKRLTPPGVEATTHGFRSSFKQWATTRTNYPDHISEMALAHKVSEGVVKAYKRKAEPYERRCRLMKQWAEFINVPPSVVVPLTRSDASA